MFFKSRYRKEIICDIAFIGIGIVSGIVSKIIDNFSYNDLIWWQNIICKLDIGNILSRISVWALIACVIAITSPAPVKASIRASLYLFGMGIGYYYVTNIIFGFFPLYYMKRWAYVFLLTPFYAVIVWYGKNGRKMYHIFWASCVEGLFLVEAIGIGLWYVDILYYPEVIFLLCVIAFFHTNKKRSFLSMIGAIILYPVIKVILGIMVAGL